MLGKERIEQISALTLACILLASVVMSGAAHPEVVSYLGFTLFGVFILTWTMTRASTVRVPLHVFILLSLMYLGSILQWLPLPRDFVTGLSPETVRQFTMAYRGYELPNTISLSLAPSASLHRGVQYFCLILALLLLSLAGRQPSPSTSDSHRAERAFIVLGGVLLLVMVGMEAFEYRFFEYSPQPTWRGLGPFINTNHGGGFAALLAMWMLHCAQKVRSFYRWIAVLLSLCFCLLVGFSLSRGAILALVLGFGIAVSLPVLTRKRLDRSSGFILIPFALMFIALLIVEHEAFRPLVRELLTLQMETGASKVTPWLGVPQLMMLFPFGTGIGGLYGILPQLDLSLEANGRIFFLENQVLQLLVDWGPIGGIGLGLGFISVLSQITKRRILSKNPFFFAGLLLLFIHNLVDFNSTLFSVQLLLLFGYVSVHRRYLAAERSITLGPRRLVAVLVLGALPITYGYSQYGNNGMPVDYAELSDLMNNAPSPKDIDEALKNYKLLHPMDVFGDLMAARKLRKFDVSRERVLARVNVAMMLQPHFAQPHLEASQILLSYGAKRQAIGEFIRAWDRNPHALWNGHAIQPNLESLFKSLASKELAERATVLNPTLRYGLWNMLRREGVFLPEVILRDSSWLESPAFINLRAEAHFTNQDPKSVLDDCKLWQGRYPVLRTCGALEFKALDLLGEKGEALSRAKKLWQFDVYSGAAAWDYFSRLNGKKGCEEFLTHLEQHGDLIRFSHSQEDAFRQKQISCLITLDYRRRFELQVNEYLNSSNITNEFLGYLLKQTKAYRPLLYTLICEKNSLRWEEKLKVKVDCH